jgi:hypothetical protein
MATTNKQKTKTQAKKSTKKSSVKSETKKSADKKSSAKSTTEKNKSADKETVKNIVETTTVEPVKTVENKPAKRRIVANYNDLAPELIDLLNEQYPLGWRNFIIKVEKGNGDFFHAIMLDTEDVSYLIKVKVKVDSEFNDEVEKDLFGNIPDEDFMVEEEQEEEYDKADDN